MSMIPYHRGQCVGGKQRAMWETAHARCFPHVTMGLHIHKLLSIADPAPVPGHAGGERGLSMTDFVRPVLARGRCHCQPSTGPGSANPSWSTMRSLIAGWSESTLLEALGPDHPAIRGTAAGGIKWMSSTSGSRHQVRVNVSRLASGIALSPTTKRIFSRSLLNCLQSLEEE
jgi:hypothetical protein